MILFSSSMTALCTNACLKDIYLLYKKSHESHLGRPSAKLLGINRQCLCKQSLHEEWDNTGQLFLQNQLQKHLMPSSKIVLPMYRT